LEDFLNPTTIDKYIYYINGYKNNSNNYSPLWNGETSSAYGGGAANMSDKFVAGFLWLDKLGLSALQGIDIVIRQAFIGAGGAYAFGNYNLLNQEMKPNTVRDGNWVVPKVPLHEFWTENFFSLKTLKMIPLLE
jgi:heparanase